MAVLSSINFLCFVVVAKSFVYNVDVKQNKPSLEMNPALSQNNERISQSIPRQDASS
jgi:peptide/histidine transporter 3/4